MNYCKIMSLHCTRGQEAQESFFFAQDIYLHVGGRTVKPALRWSSGLLKSEIVGDENSISPLKVLI